MSANNIDSPRSLMKILWICHKHFGRIHNFFLFVSWIRNKIAFQTMETDLITLGNSVGNLMVPLPK